MGPAVLALGDRRYLRSRDGAMPTGSSGFRIGSVDGWGHRRCRRLGDQRAGGGGRLPVGLVQPTVLAVGVTGAGGGDRRCRGGTTGGAGRWGQALLAVGRPLAGLGARAVGRPAVRAVGRPAESAVAAVATGGASGWNDRRYPVVGQSVLAVGRQTGELTSASGWTTGGVGGGIGRLCGWTTGGAGGD